MRANTAAAVQQFVTDATPLAAAEPGTLQWFGAQFENKTEQDFLIFDTFATEAARDAHLGGDVAAGLLSQIGTSHAHAYRDADASQRRCPTWT